MGTRSGIVFVDKKRTHGVYCHWNGCPEHNGRILLEHYQDREKILELMQLGALSSLGEKVKPTGEHSFDKPEERCTVAYHRDRGEELGLFSSSSAKEVCNTLCRSEIEYLYLYRDGEWEVAKFDLLKNKLGRLRPLKEVIDVLNP